MRLLRRSLGQGDAPPPRDEARVPRTRSDFLSEIEEVGVGSFWATNAQGEIAYLSETALTALGKSGAALVGKPLTSVFLPADSDGEAVTARSLNLKLRSQGKIEEQIVQIELDRVEGGQDGGSRDGGGKDASGKDGGDKAKTLWWKISARPYFGPDNRFLGYRGVATDITRDFTHQQMLARQSQYDELTGLANRRRINRKLSAMLGAFKTRGRSCALLMLDLDRFKQVNDTMGHPCGDELLKLVAERLRSIVKDTGEVGRLGGDEFQIIMPDVDDRGLLGETATRIIQLVSQPYMLAGRRVMIGASVGIAIAPYDGIDAAELNAAVDMALYSAKACGKGTYRFYTSELKDAASRGARIEGDLRDALVKGEISLVYQPLVDPRENRVRGFEALMRWEHPEEGFISPAQFIPIAEQTDLIIKLGEWALRQACMDAVQWPNDKTVAVNISTKHFNSPDFRKSVASALAASRLSPRRLELEITETVFIGNDENVDKTFASLKKLGVRLSMDDFGTGYSSLGYLKRAPFDKIKIDQSFVRGCTLSGDTNPAIITAIVALAKALGMETVAEGVEAMDELTLVTERGADQVQGYIFSRPLSQAQVLAQFEQGEPIFRAKGPPRHRADRISVLRKIGLIHEDHYYNVILRNISKTGASIDGLAGVPVGEAVVLDLGGGQLVVGKVMHSREGRQGLQFEIPLISDGHGALVTRHRISPYALAEAGMPLAALDGGSYPFHRMQKHSPRPPAFVQLELSREGM